MNEFLRMGIVVVLVAWTIASMAFDKTIPTVVGIASIFGFMLWVAA